MESGHLPYSHSSATREHEPGRGGTLLRLAWTMLCGTRV